MSSCPVCDSVETSQFMTRARVPVHQNLVVDTRVGARGVTRGDLEMLVCHACGFVFNDAFNPALLEYGESYDNTQCHSPFFGEHMQQLARRLLEKEGVRGLRVVEVGCGKGDFLRLLVSDDDAGNTGIGFDPSYAGDDEELGGRLRFERRYYDAACAGVPADVVISRHVAEHVPRPLEMLGAVRQALSKAKRPRIYFETPCVEWILRNQVVWDFFYEHCSLFSSASLRTIFQRAGFTVSGVRHIFGGQYLWIEAELLERAPELSCDAGAVPALAAAFGDAERELCDALVEKVDRLRAQGNVALWGAGAKGTTFAHLIDPGSERLDCVVDINPKKQGRFVPGTGHPIVAPEDLAARDVICAILMNPNYRDENLRLLADRGISIRLVD